jgi:hypothetical protein
VSAEFATPHNASGGNDAPTGGEPGAGRSVAVEQEILRDHRPHAAGATQLRGDDGQVQQGSFMRETA